MPDIYFRVHVPIRNSVRPEQWGSRDVLDVTFVDPHLVVEVAVDVARDAAGRWRHPVQLHRARPDLPSRAVPPYGA
ncbi:hypothetical protein ACF1AU_05535 [Streptomyces rubrogriseus]|uniref:hypothetical protein n=1 Tax=Streptomyces rubrogriseus TaxID=194673 RepID=UPI0036FED864